MDKKMIKAVVWSAIGGAVVMIIFVFSVGWVVSSGSAQEKAEQMAEEAVIELSVPICVAQFQQDPNRTACLEELKKTKITERSGRAQDKENANVMGQLRALGYM